MRRRTLIALLLVALAVPLAPPARAGVTTRVSVASDGTQGNNASYFESISADGRCVAFHSWASNLVPGDTNGAADVFVRDRATGRTERVSVASDGTQGNGGSGLPSISADGRFVAFKSTAMAIPPVGPLSVSSVSICVICGFLHTLRGLCVLPVKRRCATRHTFFAYPIDNIAGWSRLVLGRLRGRTDSPSPRRTPHRQRSPSAAPAGTGRSSTRRLAHHLPPPYYQPRCPHGDPCGQTDEETS